MDGRCMTRRFAESYTLTAQLADLPIRVNPRSTTYGQTYLSIGIGLFLRYVQSY